MATFHETKYMGLSYFFDQKRDAQIQLETFFYFWRSASYRLQLGSVPPSVGVISKQKKVITCLAAI